MNAMSGLMRWFGGREAGDPSKLADLFVMIDGSGWRLARTRPSDAGQAVEAAVQSGAPSPNAGNAGSPIEAAFADAARNIGNPRSIGRLHILLDDPNAAYVDLLKSNLATAGSQALHEYAAEMVGQPRVAWGRARVTETGSRAADAHVMGIQGLVDLNGYLTRLDEHAVKVKRLVPVLDLVRRHLVTGEKTGPLCGLYIAGRYSHLMLTHPEQGGVLARVIHTGREDFVDALWSGMGIDAAEAASMLSERDLLSGIAGAEGTDMASEVSRSAVDRAIGDLARRYTAAISETLDFFADQRVLGRPAEIKILDAGNHPRGLDHLVGEHVGVAAETEAFDPFATFRAMPLDDGLNLLEETSSDLRIGSVSYRVHQGTIRSVEEIAREDRLQAATAATKPEARPRSPERRGRGRSRRSEQSGGILSRLLARRASPATPDGAAATDLAAQDRQVGLLAILLIVVAGYFGYLEIEDQDRHLRNEINILGATYRANVDLKQGRDDATRAITRGGEIDKVLWTEKFLSLAENMNESMWLTDVYLEVNNRTIGESEIEEKKLVIQGAVLPSTDGHILQIAEFVERLEQDKQGFMDDFREILFDGAFLDRGESDAVVRFTIEARYDAKKRQTVVTQAKRPAASSLGEATKKVEERKKAQEKAIGGNTQ